MTRTNNRQKNEQKGRFAEYFVIFYMAIRGHRCLAMRYKCSAGEIDLIFKRGNSIIFCEVKYRSDEKTLLYSVSNQQKQRIRRAAEFWLAQKNLVRHNIRFDFIGLTKWKKPTHIKDAF